MADSLCTNSTASNCVANPCDTPKEIAPEQGAPSMSLELDEEYFCNTSSSSHQETVLPQEAALPLPLDEASFASFAPLIRSCQDYARLSGCRFSIRAFDGIGHMPFTQVPIVDDERAKDPGPLLSAKLRAAASVRSFAERLRSGELELVEDLTRAFELVTKESARNSMIASCKAEDFFPPSPAPSSVKDEDCAWDEVGLASAPVIAQRLYNDEVHRLHNIVEGSNQTVVRAKTASFVVEFADEIGVGLPQMPPQRTDMIQQFQQLLKAWTTKSSQPSSSQSSGDAPLSMMLQGTAISLHGKADKCYAKGHTREALVLGTAALAVVGAVGMAAHVGACVARSAIQSHPRVRSRRSSRDHIPHHVH